MGANLSRRVKLSDVAEAAGVSLGTASNAFNHPQRVRDEIREQVRATARDLGYHGPDPVGRLLMGAKANAIGILPPGDMPVSTAVRSPFFREFVLGVAEVCDEHGASLVMISGAPERKGSAIRNALVDGFILGHRNEIDLVAARQRQVPSVVMDMDGGPTASSVQIEARAGARLAVAHLLGLGHRQFAIVSVQRVPERPTYHPPSTRKRRLQAGYPLDQQKLLGYAEALESAGIPIGEVPIIESYPHPPLSADGARMLFDVAPHATAILAMSDRNAIAILEEAGRRGIRIPGDVSVVGFDNVPDAAVAAPPLTTIAQPLVEKGRIAARILFEGGDPRREILPVDLVVRASTSRPRQS